MIKQARTMATEEHVPSRIIAHAAKAKLAPLGLVQKGRSRTWLDDRRTWVGVVEFQPSDFARGTYLNVGCNWLWIVKDSYSFDIGGRVAEFEPFDDKESFSAIAASLVDRDAKEIQRFRTMLSDERAWCDFYRFHERRRDLWPSFHAAVAFGLAGRVDDAHRCFQRVEECPSDVAWVTAAHEDAVRLRGFLADASCFRNAVAERIMKTRALLKLPPLSADSLRLGPTSAVQPTS